MREYSRKNGKAATLVAAFLCAINWANQAKSRREYSRQFVPTLGVKRAGNPLERTGSHQRNRKATRAARKATADKKHGVVLVGGDSDLRALHFCGGSVFVPHINAFSALWHSFWGFAPMLILNLFLCFYSAWNGTPRFADPCRVSKLGVTRLNAMQNIAWRNIANYRFEPCDDAPNLRVLIVEACGRKAPLRLYYEGEQLEARLRDAMAQGIASTRETISQGTITA